MMPHSKSPDNLQEVYSQGNKEENKEYSTYENHRNLVPKKKKRVKSKKKESEN